MNIYNVKIRTWPYSTSNGADKDKLAVGDEFRTFEVRSEDFKGAVACAGYILEGVKSNPAVWKTMIESIIRTDP